MRRREFLPLLSSGRLRRLRVKKRGVSAKPYCEETTAY
jgi:hypothetical protein